MTAQDPKGSVLAAILEATRARVAVEKQRCSIGQLPPPTFSRRNFTLALSQPGLSLIAEIKRRSPSRGLLRDPFDPRVIAETYERHASAISVVIEPAHFGGSLQFLEIAKGASSLPILAKDFTVDRYQIHQARSAGADAILLMASVLPVETIRIFLEEAEAIGLACLVEVHDDSELEAVLATPASIVGVNARNLHDLSIDLDRPLRLGQQIKAAGRLFVAESGVGSPAEVDRLRGFADAVLIGTSLMLAPDLSAKLKELGW